MGTVLCGGCFNRIHWGHVYFLRQCLEKGDKLVVVLANDVNNQKKGARSAKERQENLRQLGIATTVLIGTKNEPLAIIKKIAPAVICLGYDQKLPKGVLIPGDWRLERISRLSGYKKVSSGVMGQVFTGQKKASLFLQQKSYAKRLKKITGQKIFPGTLNLRLAREGVIDLLDTKKKQIIAGFKEGLIKRGGLVVYPVKIRQLLRDSLKIKECEAWVVFPQKTGYNNRVLELIGKANFRKSLALADGDFLEVVF